MIGLLVASVLVFGGVVVGLVALLMVARKQLVAEGEVTLHLNEGRDVKVAPNQSVLSALSSQGIFLPSACGGKGTCAMCKCQVLEGGGDPLPIEKGQLTLRELKDHVRLGCQVKIKSDLRIEVPHEVFGIKKWTTTVVSNRGVATFIKELVLQLPPGEHLDFEPGGYVQIDVPKYAMSYKDFAIEDKFREDWDKFKLWDLKAANAADDVFRAYSMANYPAEGDIIKLNIRIATPPRGLDVPPGLCSSYVFGLKPGDKVTVSGPYGEFKINRTQREMIYIGGGAGMAPLRSQLFHMFKTEHERNRKISYWYGARSMREIFYDDEFEAIAKEFPNFSFHIALSEPLAEDDWKGPVGFIHKVVYDQYLSKHEAPEDCEYYLCGPPVMLAAVNKMLYDLGVPPDNIRADDFGI